MFDFDIETGEIWIHDEIGPSWYGLIDSKLVKNALNQMQGKHAVVRLNTPGGSVDHGIAIFNMLSEYKGGVTTIVDSLAASMGSYLLQAGEWRIVTPNSMVMVHDPWSISIGNSSVMRKDADILDKYAQRMIPEYARRSGKTTEEITAIMQDETWYVGKEVVDTRFADEIQTPAKGHVYAPVLGHQLPLLAKHMPDGLEAAARHKQIKPKTRADVAEDLKRIVNEMTARGELPPPVHGDW